MIARIAAVVLVALLARDAHASCEAEAQRLLDEGDTRASFDKHFWEQFAASFSAHVDPDQREAANIAVVAFWQPRFADEMDKFWLDTVEVPLGAWWVDRLGCKALKRIVRVDPDAAADTLPPGDRAAVEAMIAALPDFTTWAHDQSGEWAKILLPRLMPLTEADGPAFIADMQQQGFRLLTKAPHPP